MLGESVWRGKAHVLDKRHKVWRGSGLWEHVAGMRSDLSLSDI